MVDLTYRDLRPADFDDLHEIVSHWSVVRQLGGWPWPPVPEHTRVRCKPFDGNGFVWAICQDDRLCGVVGVTGGDLGYMLSPAHHGKGIMSQATHAAVAHAFATSEFDHLTGSTWFDNAPSYRLLQKLGFAHWQSRYMHAKARARPTLVYHQRLSRLTWDRLSTAANSFIG
jgi:RimJ/RimL family protein N-acetyltransferase